MANIRQLNRNYLLYTISSAAFLVFFQAFMVAPIIPKLAQVFKVSPTAIGSIIPAFLIPYGVSTLFYGPLSDRYGRKPILYFCLSGFIVLTGLTSISRTASAIFLFRLFGGLFAGGIVPIALALISDLFLYEERGHAIGWLFGAMAGGMAFGSTFGAVLEPFISWRMLFLSVAVLISIVFAVLLQFGSLLNVRRSGKARPSILAGAFRGYVSLIRLKRGLRTYIYVFLNGVLHSGIYTWLGYLFFVRYDLGEVGIGIALLGYGIPGFLFGPAIGKLADRVGRRRLIPAGLVIAGMSSILLAFHLPVPLAALVIAVLSLGYDMTQPLLAGIVTDLSPDKGLAIGMMAFVLFLGFGIGSMVFSSTMQRVGMHNAFIDFGLMGAVLALLAVPLYKHEKTLKSMGEKKEYSS